MSVSRLKDYYQLTKPGIIYGNSMTAAAGFLLASDGSVNLVTLFAAVAGIAFVIACGCVLNNYIDRSIDEKMKRTKKRAIVTGLISGKNALLFAGLLAVVGFTILAVFVNWLCVLLGAAALIFYVVIYGKAKRASVHGTLVGSISGSMPLVAGYCAASGTLDETALLLFIILATWQMPHFYAIAIFRSKEYKAAGIPVLPVVKGIRAAKMQILVYIILFTAACMGLAFRGHAGIVYAVIMLAVCMRWLQLAVHGYSTKDDIRWARKLFGFSLIVLLVFSFMISADSWLRA